MTIKILMFCAVFLAGCIQPITIHPIPVDTKITQLCIVDNPKVFMSGFLPELKSQLHSYGIATQDWTGYNPEGCRYWLEYTANWRLNLIVSMYYAELKLYDKTALIAGATYDDRGFGFHHEGSAAGKLKELTWPLFRQSKTE